MFPSFSERVTGLDELGFVGDNFVAGTFRPFFKNVKTSTTTQSDFYCNDHFEVFAFCDSKYSSNNVNYISRLCNTFAAAVSKRVRLPACVVFIFEDDLIESVGYKDNGVSCIYGNLLNWLISDVKAIVADQKKKLPKKAIKNEMPVIYWSSLPLHTGFPNKDYVMRVKFNNCLESIIKQHGPDMRVIHFKDHWDLKKVDLVHDGRISVVGKVYYWKALDAVIRFNIGKRHEFLARNLVGKNQSDLRSGDPMLKFFKKHKEDRQQHLDRFHWHRGSQCEDGQHTGSRGNNRFCLPRPT